MRTGETRSQIAIGGPSLVLGYFVAVALGLPVAFMLNSEDRLIPMAVALGAGALCMVIFESRRIGHPLTPAGVVAAGGILIFAFRPITVALNGDTTAGAVLDTRMYVGVTVTAADMSMLQLGLFYLAFGVFYFSQMGRPPVGHVGLLRVSDQQVRRARFVMLAVTVAAIAASLYLIQGSGGLAAHLEGLGSRSVFLAGRYFLTLVYIPLVIALCLDVLARRFNGRREWSAVAIAVGVIACGIAFITGGRGPLLLGVILPLLLLKQTGPTKFKPRTLAVIGILLLAVAMWVSIFFRESQYDDGRSLGQLENDPIGFLLNRLTSGSETRPFDSLILLNEIDLQGSLPTLWGWTYLKAPTWFLPGEIFGDKGGANTWFTSTYIPRYFYPNHIETSISAAGEAYANFRWIGVFIVGALLALAAAKLSVTRSGDGLVKTLFAVTLTPLFFSFIRSDSYHNVSTAIVMIGFTLVFLWMSVGIPKPEQRSLLEATSNLRPRQRGNR